MNELKWFVLLSIADLGSEEESGKDWSDLEREAAEDDANYSNKHDDSIAQKKKSSHDRRDKHKNSKNHRYRFLWFSISALILEQKIFDMYKRE